MRKIPLFYKKHPTSENRNQILLIEKKLLSNMANKYKIFKQITKFHLHQNDDIFFNNFNKFDIWNNFLNIFKGKLEGIRVSNPCSNLVQSKGYIQFQSFTFKCSNYKLQVHLEIKSGWHKSTIWKAIYSCQNSKELSKFSALSLTYIQR